VVAEEIADGAERAGPDRRAGKIVERKAASIHVRDAGNDRDEHSHNGHEAAEKHSAGAVSLEKAVGARERVIAAVGAARDERRTAAAEIVRGRRPSSRRQRRDDKNKRERQMPARRQRRRGDDGGVGRKWDCQPFTEEEKGDQCVTVMRYEPNQMRGHDL
jgi:hypothetical protein